MRVIASSYLMSILSIQQISIFLENRVGKLNQVTNLLAKFGIDIRTIALADTNDFGILRLIVNDTEKALSVLQENNFTAKLTNVVAVKVPDEPGGLATILGKIDEIGVSVEYMYAYTKPVNKEAVMIFRFADDESAIKSLQDKNVEKTNIKPKKTKIRFLTIPIFVIFYFVTGSFFASACPVISLLTSSTSLPW